jgi:hypothetical protein
MRLTVLTFFLLLTLAVTGGCGIKPKAVDAPAGTEKDSFPKTYPNPAPDPHP